MTNIFIHHSGLGFAGFQILQGAFAGQDEAGVNSRIDAAGNIRIKPIAHHHSLLFAVAKPLHGKQGHLRLGLADEFRPPPCGPEEHLADTAAVRHIAIPGGAHPVRVGSNERHPPVQQDAAVLQLLEGQLRIKSGYQNLNAVLQLVGDADPALNQLFLEGLGARCVAQLPGAVGLQIQHQRIDRGQKILRRCFDPQPRHFLHVSIHAAGGIIGQKQILAADFLDMMQKVHRSVKQVVIQIDGAIHIQQEQPFFRQVTHSQPPLLLNCIIQYLFGICTRFDRNGRIIYNVVILERLSLRGFEEAVAIRTLCRHDLQERIATSVAALPPRNGSIIERLSLFQKGILYGPSLFPTPGAAASLVRTA